MERNSLWFLAFFYLSNLGSFSIVNAANALVERRALQKKTHQYFSDGVVIGGKAGRGFSLIGVDRKLGKVTQMERILFDIGDELGAPVSDSPGYFHIEISKKNKQIIVDLAQAQRSLVSEEDLRKKLSGSPYVQLARVIYDPEDKATSFILKMKQDLKVEVFSPQNKSEPGRIILDLKPENVQTEGRALPDEKANPKISLNRIVQ
jgi:hypothetical protein